MTASSPTDHPQTQNTSLAESETAKLRREYAGQPLDEHSIRRDPFVQFNVWFDEAVTAKLPLANAMSLATVSAENKPSARIVLLKEIESGDFLFYTNYESRKSRELDGSPKAALIFFWVELDRQVRVEGSVRRVTSEESDRYFATRPRGSQVGAHASVQSTLLANRAELEERFLQIQHRYGDTEIPRPPHWGGFRLTPDWIEFWQGRESRLHDRISYTRQTGNDWRIERLSP